MTHKEIAGKLHNLFREWDGKLVKKHGGRYGQKGEPDLYGCICGRFFAIEIKSKYDTLSDIQAEKMREWQVAGAACVIFHENKKYTHPVFRVFHSIEEFENLLETIRKTGLKVLKVMSSTKEFKEILKEEVKG